MLLESTDVGIAALDFERNLLFINQQAERICGSVRNETLSKHECRRGTSVIPASLLKDLEALHARFRNDQKIGIDSFPAKERIISTGNTEKFRFRARLVNGRLPDVDGPLFLITMETLPLYPKLDQRAVKEMCNFTKRESEIVSYIFKGYRNAEIAESLFISEGTVKNHLRNIF
ncbi:MAG: helix-turn-helix transcriptional regulator, partial [Deltaproteobacteria bacterium]|nr:helix-turn-helix transcriptional regulator [Deltaproteobacteria bacterium]